MSDRESGDEQSQVAQRGVHRFSFHHTETLKSLSAAPCSARLHSYCRKPISIACLRVGDLSFGHHPPF